ncbi:MAG: hypothetical protein LUC16_02970 [Coprobacillus sp.]|nr:hypothetical protein [Coprobacillus sp.]
MADNHGPNFTDAEYATRSEVSNRLKLGYIDGVWSQILAYRNDFSHLISLRLVDNTAFSFCYAPGIEEKIDHIDNLAARFEERVASLALEDDYASYQEISHVDCLKEIVNAEHLIASETDLYKIAEDVSLAPKEASSLRNLSNYMSALKFIETYPFEEVDEDLLSLIYSKLTGNDNLTSFYRETDEVNKTLIGKTYDSAPSEYIDRMMYGLFTFLNSSDLHPLVKTLIISFYICYVKPFPSLNTEVSTLLMKSELIKEYGPEMAYVPIEKFFSATTDQVKKMSIEVQTTKDITYYVYIAMPFLEKAFTQAIDRTSSYRSVEIRRDFYQADETTSKSEKVSLFDNEEEKIETPVVETPVIETPVIETPVIETPVIETPIVETPIVDTPVVEESYTAPTETVVAPKVEPAPSAEPIPETVVEENEQTITLFDEEIEEEVTSSDVKVDLVPPEIKPVPKVEAVRPAPEEKKEEKKVEPEIAPEPKVEPSPIVEQSPAPREERVGYSPAHEEIASYLPPVLDEREAQRLEEHLLELDPSMHKGEAAFYARHCTLGKKYTISQCKKYLGCAYETARKTMEGLTELGYYKREMVKNKSVYTPVDRKK